MSWSIFWFSLFIGFLRCLTRGFCCIAAVLLFCLLLVNRFANVVSLYAILFYSLLFYSSLFQAVSFHWRKKPSAKVLQLSLSFAILVHTAPCYPTTSSLRWRFGLPTDLTPFICHSVLLMVHLLSFIRAKYPAPFHFALVTYWTMSVTLLLCLVMVLQILSFSLTFSIFLSMDHWLVSRALTNPFVWDHVWHPQVIAGKTQWLKTCL